MIKQKIHVLGKRALLLALLATSAYAQQDLLVFLPGDGNRSSAVQDLGKSGLNVKMFNNVKDFEKEREGNPSAAIIAPSPLIEITGGYDYVLRGYRGSDIGEKFLLVTANDDVQMANIADKKVGVWDIFGRKNVEPFFQRSFGIASKKIKRVNKKEDLLTLLGVDMVDAILVSKSDFEKFKKTTDVKLRVLSESRDAVGFISVAVPRGGNGAALKNLAGAKSFLRDFAFDGWRAK